MHLFHASLVVRFPRVVYFADLKWSLGPAFLVLVCAYKSRKAGGGLRVCQFNLNLQRLGVFAESQPSLVVGVTRAKT